MIYNFGGNWRGLRSFWCKPWNKMTNDSNQWLYTQPFQQLNRTCFGIIDFFELDTCTRTQSIAKLIPPKISIAHFFHFTTSIRWRPLPPPPAKCRYRRILAAYLPQAHHPQMDTSLMRTQKMKKMIRLIKTLKRQQGLDGLAKNSWKLLVIVRRIWSLRYYRYCFFFKTWKRNRVFLHISKGVAAR